MLFNTYDESADNLIAQWFDVANKQLGNHVEVRRRLHEERQGLPMFDKILGCQWGTDGK